MVPERQRLVASTGLLGFVPMPRRKSTDKERADSFLDMLAQNIASGKTKIVSVEAVAWNLREGVAEMKLIKDMNEPELRSYFNRMAKLIEDWLPPGPSAKGKCLFFLIVNDQIEPGIAQYVSNVQREDAIKMLRETADRLELNQDVTR